MTNATLQCLLHTTELSNFFLRGLHRMDMNVDNPLLGCKGKLAESFHLLLVQTHSHSARGAPINKTRVRTAAPVLITSGAAFQTSDARISSRSLTRMS